MASGISSGAWGFTPRQIAGIDNYSSYNNNKRTIPLTYEQSINSYIPVNYISPLTKANMSFYNKFGRRRSRFGAEHDEICTRFNENRCVNPLSGAPIKKDGPTYRQLVQRCSATVLPESRRPSVSLDTIKKGNKSINVNGKIFNIGNTAIIYNSGETGKIIKVGQKQIVLIKSDNKERRLNINDFINLNN